MNPGQNHKLQNLIDRVEYRPGVKIYLQMVSNRNAFEILIRGHVPCAHSRNGTIVKVASKDIFEFKFIDRVIENFEQIIRDLIIKFEIHEAEEWLLFDGKRIFWPHEKENK